MARGGYREGAGKKPGTVASHTKAASLKKAYIIKRVNAATDALLNSQIALGTGLSFLYKIEKDEKGKNKKPELVTNQVVIEAYLNGDYKDSEDYYYITAVKPDNNAIDSLFDRTHGRPSQNVELGGPDGQPITVKVVKYD